MHKFYFLISVLGICTTHQCYGSSLPLSDCNPSQFKSNTETDGDIVKPCDSPLYAKTITNDSSDQKTEKIILKNDSKSEDDEYEDLSSASYDDIAAILKLLDKAPDTEHFDDSEYEFSLSDSDEPLGENEEKDSISAVKERHIKLTTRAAG